MCIKNGITFKKKNGMSLNPIIVTTILVQLN